MANKNLAKILTKDVLEKEYKTKGINQIARDYGINEKSVTFYLDKYNIPRYKTDKASKVYLLENFTYDYFYELYVNKQRSMQYLAEIHNTFVATIKQCIDHYKIKPRKKFTEVDLTNQTFGKLFLYKKEVSDTSIYYKCKCKCGKECTRRFYCTNDFNDKSSCGKCKHYEEITGEFWGRLLNGAKKRNLSFNITQQYVWELFLKQNRQCAYTKLPLQFSNKINKTTVSVDRINSKLGYEEDNIQIVHKAINLMKNATDHKLFIHLCKTIATVKKDIDTSEFNNKSLTLNNNTIISY